MASSGKLRACPFWRNEQVQHDWKLVVDSRSDTAWVECACGARGPLGNSGSAAWLWNGYSDPELAKIKATVTGLEAAVGRVYAEAEGKVAAATALVDEHQAAGTRQHERIVVMGNALREWLTECKWDASAGLIERTSRAIEVKP